MRRVLLTSLAFAFLLVVPKILLAQPLSYPATGVWNGFLGHQNVVECANASDEAVSLELIVSDTLGQTLGSTIVGLEAYATAHSMLNLFQIADSYGTYRLTVLEGDASRVRCHTAFYRMASIDAAKPVEYAFSLPVADPLHGESAGVYNSINPTLGIDPVFNWLSVYNPGTEPVNATVYIYDQLGQIDNSRTITITQLEPGARQDHALGHEQGQVVGLYRIVPESDAAVYGAFLTRFSQTDNGSFRFAFPLLSRSGSCNPGPLPASTMDPALNYGEVANPTAADIPVHIEVRNRDGIVVFEEQRVLEPFSQHHVFLHEHLGERNVGSFQVRCIEQANLNKRILVQSLYYGKLTSNTLDVEWAYASQAGGGFAPVGSQAISFLNTFLGAANWNKYFEANYSDTSLTLDLLASSGESVVSAGYDLPQGAALDIAMHDTTLLGPDAIGLALATPESGATLVNSELLRVFPHSAGNIGYIMNVASPILYVFPETLEEQVLEEPFDCDAADLNSDGSVDNADLLIVQNYWLSENAVADLNNDGVVDLVDLGLAASCHIASQSNTSPGGGPGGGNGGGSEGPGSGGGSGSTGGGGSTTSAPVCVTSNSSWQNFAFPLQQDQFTVTYAATPHGIGIDGVTAFSEGSGASYQDFAILVRFNSQQNLMDARNGESYAADIAMPYFPGVEYDFRLEVNVAAHTYSVFVAPSGGTEVALGTNFQFRTEENSISLIDNWGIQAGNGSHTVCDINTAAAAAECGNGLIEGEFCDDGNLQSGDGCSASCSIETGYVCSGAPSICLGASSSTTSACEDGIDNDNDGFTDYPADEGCTSPADNSENNPGDAPIIAAGNGFGGSTPQPAAVGSASAVGYNAKAIARWNVLPHQIFHNQFEIGVVAFHINGIDRVEFSAEAGPWTAVTEMSYNARTDTYEYWGILDAADFPDGQIEIRARIFPASAGQPRVLQGALPPEVTGQSGNVFKGNYSLKLTANSGGSVPERVRWVSNSGDDDTGDGSEQNPFATEYAAIVSMHNQNGAPLYASHGTVYHKAGDYFYAGRPSCGGSCSIRPRAPVGWVTLAAAPGLPQSAVRIVPATDGSDESNADLVRFKNVTLQTGVSAYGPHNSMVWFDSCVLQGGGDTDNQSWAGTTTWTGGVYLTDSHIKDTKNGVGGASLHRNCLATNIGSDAFQNALMVVNTTADGITFSTPDAHPDVIQYYGNFENIIVYNLQAFNAHAQGIFSAGSTHTRDDIAFVNVFMELTGNMLNQWNSTTDHILFWNVTTVNRAFKFWEEAAFTDLSVKNSSFEEMWYDPNAPNRVNCVLENNHFEVGSSYGSNVTVGNPLFVNPAQDNYRPSSNSPLNERVTTPLVPADSSNAEVVVPGSIGAFQP